MQIHIIKKNKMENDELTQVHLMNQTMDLIIDLTVSLIIKLLKVKCFSNNKSLVLIFPLPALIEALI